MLPLKNLDDRNYEQIVEEARRMIPKIFPQWTDENVHDPGITLIELFAWLTEMQQFYLNRITANSERKFLKLMGVHPRDARSARTDVRFSGVDKLEVVPIGTKLMANEQMFETEETLRLVPSRLEKIIVESESVSQDFTAPNSNEGVSFYAFGVQPVKGNRWYAGLDAPLPSDTELMLTIKVYDPFPVASEEDHSDAVRLDRSGWKPSTRICWYYYAGDGEDGWQPLEVSRDDTFHLTRSGRIRFRVPGTMRATQIYPATDRPRYWISCVLEEGRYELSPRLEHVALNMVSAVHRDTQSLMFEFRMDEHAAPEFTVEHYLARAGRIRVQVKEENGLWREWSEAGKADDKHNQHVYSLQMHDRGATIRFGVQGANVPAPNRPVRIIAESMMVEHARKLGSSNGLPHQQFPLYGSILRDSMLLQVGHEDPNSGEMLWEDWQAVDDFDASGNDDPHYVYDADQEIIRFGDHEHGRIPPKANKDNIYLLTYAYGGGEQGNIKRHLMDTVASLDRELSALQVENPYHATGGRDRESLDDAKKRLLLQLRQPTRAVTREDYEQLCLRTPGVRVARVCALPLYSPGMRDYPEQEAHGQVTVVAVPYSESPTPVPTDGFLQTVKNYLDRHRLISTELHVIPPEYIQVTVHAVVVTESREEHYREAIVKTLNDILRPLGTAKGEDGWPFGRTVYKGDIYGVITRLKGIAYIQELWLDATGKGCRKTAAGDVTLPPHGLVFSGQHEISLVSQDDL